VNSDVQIQWDSEERLFILSSSVVLRHSREELFEFFSDAFQLEQLTPPWLNFRILTPAPIHIRTGCLIDYTIRLRGIPIQWQTEISSWDPPYSFTDRQIRGPYRLWEHLHTFETVPEGTLASDEVRYRVPGGRLINRLFVQRDLVKIFTYRQEKMLQLFSRGGGVSRDSSVDQSARPVVKVR
jgi:ligand-binding SRPBCC domain-containing protein